ncbi:DnaA N-terminal domain-containing protein [Neobacillus sp.]|uniref:DnaA N-terminal domain-containing protein n=1 Tax=Neobacillus sp. TaxID=2675273 RepID=UPI0035B55219
MKDANNIKNLKGGNYPLTYYRPIKEDVKIEKSRWAKDKNGELKKFFYHDTVVNKIIFTEEMVKEFSLDGQGQNLEFEDRNYTLIHNYLTWFWQPFLKADGLALFVTLKSYCISKDYCWPALSTLQHICGFGSINTVKKRLALLESYGFVFRFNCMSADENKKNMDESPIFKVRKRVPFLPKELYDELPEDLKIKHDSFMEEYMSVYSPENLGNMINYNDFYEELLEKGETIKKPIKRKEPTILFNQTLDIKESMTSKDEEITRHVLQFIETRLSKPSYETWFKHCLFKLRENVLTVYANNTFSAGWINDRHKDLIINALNEIDLNPIDIKIVSIQE